MDEHLAEYIFKSADQIESYIREETGNLAYKSVSDEEEYYELTGDRAGLIRFGLQLLKTAVSGAKLVSENELSEFQLTLVPLFQSGSEVIVTEIKRVDELGQIETQTKNHSKKVHKIIGLCILATILSVLIMATIGAVQILKWIF